MGNEQFERLYEEHASDLLGFLIYRTGDRALAEDVLADTFERVLRSRRRFDPRRGSAKTWVYSIALNRLRDMQRRSGSESRALERTGTRVDEDEAAPDAAFARVDDRDMLSRALAALSREEREVVALRYGSDMTAPEIASLLDEKLTTVEGRIYRALRKLRDELAARSGSGFESGSPGRH